MHKEMHPCKTKPDIYNTTVPSKLQQEYNKNLYLSFIYIYCTFHSYCYATTCKPIISVALNRIYRNICSTKNGKTTRTCSTENYAHDRSLSVLFNISRYYSCIVYKHLVTIDSYNFIPKNVVLGKTT